MTRYAFAVLLLLLPSVAMAEGYEQCEAVISQEVVDTYGGRVEVASFQPADEFLIGVFDPDVEFSPIVATGPKGRSTGQVRGVNCTRNDVLPNEGDYPLLATGTALTLSQDFTSPDSDLLTVYYGFEGFTYNHSSNYPLSEEAVALLDALLADFSARDHGLQDRLVKPE